MKRLAALIMVLTLIISLGACVSEPEQTPTPTPAPTVQPTPEHTPAVSPEPGGIPAPDKSNLKDFYQGLVESELLPEGVELTEKIADGFYEELFDVELTQRVIYLPTFNVSATEIVLVELADSSDAEKVFEIIEKRHEDLDNLWKQYLPQQYELVKNAKIVQNDNFLMFVVAERAEEIEAAFNALFEE